MYLYLFCTFAAKNMILFNKRRKILEGCSSKIQIVQ